MKKAMINHSNALQIMQIVLNNNLKNAIGPANYIKIRSLLPMFKLSARNFKINLIISYTIRKNGGNIP